MGAERETDGDVTVIPDVIAYMKGFQIRDNNVFVNVVNVDLIFSSVHQKLRKINQKFLAISITLKEQIKKFDFKNH